MRLGISHTQGLEDIYMYLQKCAAGTHLHYLILCLRTTLWALLRKKQYRNLPAYSFHLCPGGGPCLTLPHKPQIWIKNNNLGKITYNKKTDLSAK